MDMIAHRHVSIHVKSMALPVFFQTLEIVFSIRIAAENHLVLITSTNHMVKRPAYSTLGFRAMCASIFRFESLSQYESLTPIAFQHHVRMQFHTRQHEGDDRQRRSENQSSDLERSESLGDGPQPD
jgi:hypothetical protein